MEEVDMAAHDTGSGSEESEEISVSSTMLPCNLHHDSVVPAKKVKSPLSSRLGEGEEDDDDDDDKEEAILEKVACHDVHKNIIGVGYGANNCFVETYGTISDGGAHKSTAGTSGGGAEWMHRPNRNDGTGGAEWVYRSNRNDGTECSIDMSSTSKCIPGSHHDDDRKPKMEMFDANGYDAYSCSCVHNDSDKSLVDISRMNDHDDFKKSTEDMLGLNNTDDSGYNAADHCTVEMPCSNVHDDDADKPIVRVAGSNSDDGLRGFICIQVKQGSEEKEEECCCRVCHLGSEMNCTYGEAMKLGCGCKNDLGIVHRRCAEAWFKIQGHRICEICGSVAHNFIDAKCVTDQLEANSRPHPPSAAERGWKNHRCSLLLFCTIIFVIFMWLFRVTLF